MEGEPADAILATAAGQRAGLIVIGNRGMGALSGHLLGSVPGDIAHRAPGLPGDDPVAVLTLSRTRTSAWLDRHDHGLRGAVQLDAPP